MSKYSFEELKDYLFENTEKGERWCYYNNPSIEENSIAVSNYARAFSFIDGHFLKDQGQNTNYMYWYLNPWGEDTVTVPIHKAVAECFCEKPQIEDRLVIDHIDGDKHNNLASNLRWITYKENSNAQDVQKRKAESIKKTAQHRKEIETLTKLLSNKDDEIAYWKKKTGELEKEIDSLKIKCESSSKKYFDLLAKHINLKCYVDSLDDNPYEDCGGNVVDFR